jgi:ABC-2 type transport system permease protein
MSGLASKLWAFFCRDLQHEVSYRVNFLFQFAGSFFFVTTWFFISRSLAGAFQPPEELPGVSYFAFVLVGFAFFQYLQSTLNSFSSKIRQEQLTGTLEAMLVTPTPPALVILGSTLWDYLMTTFRVGVVLLLGVALARGFGGEVGFQVAGLPAFFLLLALTITAFAGIGILSAAFTVWLKRGDPVNYLISALSALLGGVFFRVEAMPGWLQPISRLLPITHALEAIRKALLGGAGLAEVAGEMRILVLFSVVLIPAGLVAFIVSLRRARVAGTLVQY